MVHLVVALQAEANPLVEALRLHGDASARPFRVYEGEIGRLVVSGVGKVAAAGATAYLQARSGEEVRPWLNVGVCAHRELGVGQAVLAHKVVDSGRQRAWYPPLVWRPNLPTATVCTVDRPIAAIEDDRAYEMEAAGFVATALRWTTAELIACLKIVSDRGVESSRQLTGRVVTELVAANLEAVREVIAALHELHSELPDEDLDLEPWASHWRLSVTQRRRLERLARRAVALGANLADRDPAASRSAQEALDDLESWLDSWTIESP